MAFLTAMALTAALLIQAPAALGQGHGKASSSGRGTLVRADGRRMTAKPAGTTKRSSFEGSGARTPTSGPNLERSVPPVSASQGRESVIGFDERVRITPTTSFPARAVTLITFSDGVNQARCSGWMSGPDTVVTAGHCVAPGGDGSLYNPSTYAVYPGYDNVVAPYGGCGVADMVTTVAFRDFGDERYDYGVLKLNCQIGLSTGWLGFFWKTTTFNGAPATLIGYPGERRLTQWAASGTIGYSGGLMLYYPNDTTGGMSGSAVYRLRPAGSPLCSGYCVMAIHTEGLHGTFPHITWNHGPRITEEVWNNLYATLLPDFWTS